MNNSKTIFALFVPCRHFINCPVLFKVHNVFRSFATGCHFGLLQPLLTLFLGKQLLIHLLIKSCKMKTRALMIGLLILYFLYFYFTVWEPVPKPPTGSPSRAPPYNLKLHSKGNNNLQFTVNNKVAWEHTLPDHTYTVSGSRVFARDACYGKVDGATTPAKGRPLYEYVKANPELNNQFSFQENSAFTLQQGDVFYFTCQNNQIKKLSMCPSGSTFSNGQCTNIGPCTNKPDGTLLFHPDVTQYIQCHNGTEIIKKCPHDQFFHHDRCIKKMDHFCKFHKNGSLKLDDLTRVDCQNGKPTYTRCEAGTQFFDKTYCEPNNCVGLADGTKLPLPKRYVDPFHFVPGYMTCRGGKIAESKECPQTWDDRLSRGDNLTFLPKVYDGQRCSVPSFGENVFSDDPDVIVPVHEFTKYVKNWYRSDFYDANAGYTMEGNTRKRKLMNPGMRIGKHFKMESACQATDPPHASIYGNSHQYYDCTSNRVVSCPPREYFNGTKCIPEPLDAFQYNGMPLFKFDSLNEESWIHPWDYSSEQKQQCTDPESTFLELYNICSHPECAHYAFLSMIPELAMLLPSKSKCKFDETNKRLKKVPADFQYHFWTQKPFDEATEKQDHCTPGQNIQTGNFVWDSTVFATCDPNHPFIFCPSVRGNGIIPVGHGHYACAPPDSNTFLLTNADWTPFAINEVKHVKPASWDNTPQMITRNRDSHTHPEPLPEDGLPIAEGAKTNLHISRPVFVKLRYRVTHPPNVAYEYDDQDQIHFKTARETRGFLVRTKNHTTKALSFPRYRSIHYVEGFIGHHLFYN